MPFIPPRACPAVAPSYTAWPHPDDLYDYLPFIGGDGPIATLPAERQGTRVAIIGAGAAGLVAAYELLRAGLTPVLFEATHRAGGRHYSRPFTDSGITTDVIAELGAMRFPTVNKVLYHYFDRFGIARQSGFPDPGTVFTRIYYQNTIHDWHPPDPPPAPFDRIADEFGAFLAPLTGQLAEAYNSGDLANVQGVWQGFLDQYASTSFYDAVVEGTGWSRDDVAAFGALGTGQGGFGPLFQVGFMEMLRNILCQFEENQELVVHGISQLPEAFLHADVTPPGNGGATSVLEAGALHLGAPVKRLVLDGEGQAVLTYYDPVAGADRHEAFEAVIVATTTRAMQMIGLALPTPERKELFSQDVKDAVRVLHLMNSSKMFIRTATKFWKGSKTIPTDILTDALPRAVYCLDYPYTDDGVVLISYTWGDDSTKMLAVPPEARFKLLRRVIAGISPEFAAHLEPVGGEVFNIDWETTPFYFGAFKLNYPGQDPALQAAYYQFLTANDAAADTGVYLAGDSVSWFGGWTEGALHTGLNAAAAVCKHLGGTFAVDSPLTQQADRYDYGR
ncbi:MAG: NAD(P)/FAD-dependent oxidoreductase [Rhodothermales bacterium]|nr:NAD(P)/FAD-dependent oxidoreductase [Rhodothermales bacterium]